jgi:TatA/E family protein of Tat protein translocase
MGSVGTPEILLVLVIALLIFGPTKLPELGKSLGRAIREFKKASAELQETIEREVDEVKRQASDPPPSASSSRGLDLPAGALPPPSTPMPAPLAPAADKEPPPPTEPR